MAKLTASTARQYPLVAMFTVNFDDTMLNTSGVEKDFGKTTVAETNTFGVINLPYGAVVTGGRWVTNTAFDTAGLDVTVGDSSTGNRYMASTDVKGTGVTALVPTGYVSDGKNLTISVQCDDVCTAGKATLYVEYIITGRTNEIQTH
jgi:hypothetical protein